MSELKSNVNLDEALEASSLLEKDLKFEAALEHLANAATLAQKEDRVKLLLAAGSLARRMKLFSRAHAFHNQALEQRGLVGGVHILPENEIEDKVAFELRTRSWFPGRFPARVRVLALFSLLELIPGLLSHIHDYVLLQQLRA